MDLTMERRASFKRGDVWYVDHEISSGVISSSQPLPRSSGRQDVCAPQKDARVRTRVPSAPCLDQKTSRHVCTLCFSCLLHRSIVPHVSHCRFVHAQRSPATPPPPAPHPPRLREVLERLWLPGPAARGSSVGNRLEHRWHRSWRNSRRFCKRRTVMLSVLRACQTGSSAPTRRYVRSIRPWRQKSFVDVLR